MRNKFDPEKTLSLLWFPFRRKSHETVRSVDHALSASHSKTARDAERGSHWQVGELQRAISFFKGSDLRARAGGAAGHGLHPSSTHHVWTEHGIHTYQKNTPNGDPKTKKATPVKGQHLNVWGYAGYGRVGSPLFSVRCGLQSLGSGFHICVIGLILNLSGLILSPSSGNWEVMQTTGGSLQQGYPNHYLERGAECELFKCIVVIDTQTKTRCPKTDHTNNHPQAFNLIVAVYFNVQ